MRKLKENLGVIIGCLLIVCSLVFAGVNISSQKSELNDAKAELEQMQGKTSQTENKGASKSLREQMKELTGFDYQKKQNDDIEAATFFEGTFNWKDTDEYVEKRKALIEKYKLDEKSDFLTVFMPDIETNDEGVPGTVLENNGIAVNMSYENMNSKVVNIAEDGTYSYIATVNVTTNNSYENSKGDKVPVTGAAQAIMTYDCDKDNNIKNVNGYIIRS